MLNPGIHSLGDFTIAGAGTQIGDWTSETVDLAGLNAALAQLRFTGGTGGTMKAYLQTSNDQGSTAIDIWCRTYTTTADVRARNFSALTETGASDVVPTDGTLADNTYVVGTLGDRFRLKVVVATPYTGSPVLSGRLCVR